MHKIVFIRAKEPGKTRLNEGFFGSYKDKTSKEDRLADIKRQTKNIIAGKLREEMIEVLQDCVKQEINTIHGLLDGMNTILYFHLGFGTISSFRDRSFLDVELTPSADDFKINVCIIIRLVTNNVNVHTLTTNYVNAIKHYLDMTKKKLLSMEKLQEFGKMNSIRIDNSNFNVKLKFVKEVHRKENIQDPITIKFTNIHKKTFENFMNLFVNKNELENAIEWNNTKIIDRNPPKTNSY